MLVMIINRSVNCYNRILNILHSSLLVLAGYTCFATRGGLPVPAPGGLQSITFFCHISPISCSCLPKGFDLTLHPAARVPQISRKQLYRPFHSSLCLSHSADIEESRSLPHLTISTGSFCVDDNMWVQKICLLVTLYSKLV